MSDIGNISIFVKNLRYYMNLNNKTRSDICNDLNLAYTTFADWYNGKIYPRIDKIELLANYFGVKKSDLIEEKNKLISNSAIVFVYGTIPAGIPMECIEDIIDTEEISTEMLKGGKQYFGLKIKGDSMEPDYLDGDIIIFQKQDDCENGDDCVVMVNGNDGTFKRIFKSKSGIRLQPLNNKYEPLIFSNKEIEQLPVKILGVFEELRRKKKR